MRQKGVIIAWVLVLMSLASTILAVTSVWLQSDWRYQQSHIKKIQARELAIGAKNIPVGTEMRYERWTLERDAHSTSARNNETGQKYRISWDGITITGETWSQ